ncbi:MAG: hypothetical protein V4538_02005 [Bacteroidota bacterium]
MVRSIADYNQVHSRAIGEGGARSKQYINFENLNKIATKSELLLLTDNANASVRCYAFLALAKRKDSSVLTILTKHLHDTTTVKTFQGCIISRYRVGDYFLDVVTSKYQEPDAYKLSLSENNLIDSILIFDATIMLSAKWSAIQRAPASEKHYERIRSIYIQTSSGKCIVYLSKFHKERDKDLIVKLLVDTSIWQWFDGLKAVRHFPANDFFPYLQTIQKRELAEVSTNTGHILGMLYRAMVQYKDSASRQMIEKVLKDSKTEINHEHAIYIVAALERFPDPIYDGLKELAVMSEYDRITVDHWKHDSFD